MRYVPLITCLAVVLLSCKKEQPTPEVPKVELNTEMRTGLPDKMDNVQGYFYSMQTWYTQNKIQYQRDNFINFSVQGGDLRRGVDFELDEFHQASVVGDLSMGTVRQDTLKITANALPGPRYYYFLRTYPSTETPKKVVWRYSGNTEIPADSFVFEHPYPELLTRGKILHLDPDSNFKVLADSIINGYTDGSVALMGHNYRSGPYVALISTINADLRYFYMTATEVRKYLTPDGASPPRTLRLKGYNHFHKYHHGQLYVFTFASMVDYEVTIYN